VVLGVAPWHAAAAQSIHKCLIDGALQYQNAPCESSQVSIPHSIPARAAIDSAGRKPTVAVSTQGTEKNLRAIQSKDGSSDLFRQSLGSDLVVGMSDTIILNRAGWGRPQKIARSHSPTGFREEWTYVARADSGTRVLQFLNGRLTAVELDTRPTIATTPASRPTVAATNAPLPVQRSDIAVASNPDAAVPAQVAATPSQDDNAGERAREAAKVLEHAGLLRSRAAELFGRPVPAADASANAAIARAPSSQGDTPSSRDASMTERGDATSSALHPPQDPIVMVHVPSPASAPRAE
jgi:hypothetical protein